MPPVTKEMLEARAAAVRTGGAGTMRRHNKIVHKSNAGDDKKVQNVVKRLGVSPIDIDEVAMLKNDKTQMVFKKPRVQGNGQNQVFVCSGAYETRELSDAEIQQSSQPSMQQMQQMMQMMQQNPQMAQAMAAAAPAAAAAAAATD